MDAFSSSSLSMGNFESENFDCTDFVNNTLDSAGTNPDAIDAVLSNASVRLHLFAQSLSARADAAMTGMVAALPRAKRDARSTSTEAAFLSTQLRALAAAGAGSSNAYVRELEQLDSVSRRLMSVQSTLTDAALWERLVRETDSALSGSSSASAREDEENGVDSSGIILGSSNSKNESINGVVVGAGGALQRMAAHLASLERAAEALKDMPDAQTRSFFLESARKTFYAQAAPQLVIALRADDESNICSVARVYHSLGRFDVFRRILAQTRAAPLTALWAPSPVAAGVSAASGAPSRFALSLAADIGPPGGSSTAKTSSFSTWLESLHRGVSALAVNDTEGLVKLFVKIAETTADSTTTLTTGQSQHEAAATSQGKADAVECLSLMLITALGAQSSSSFHNTAAVSDLQRIDEDATNDLLLSSSSSSSSSSSLSNTSPLRPPSTEAYHSRMDDEHESDVRRGVHSSHSSSLGLLPPASVKAVFLHNSAVKAARDVSAMIAMINAPTHAESAAINAIYTSLSAPFERSVIRLDEDEKESLLSIASSVPNARLALPFPALGSDKRTAFAAASLCAVLGVTNNNSSGVPMLALNNNSLAVSSSSANTTNSSLPISDAAEACSAIEEVLRIASRACPGCISRFDQLTLLSRAPHLITEKGAIVAFVTDLAQRVYASAAALHDSTVLPLVSSAAAQRAAAAASILSTRENTTAGAGTITRSSAVSGPAGTSVSSLAAAASAKSSSSSSSMTISLQSQSSQAGQVVALPPLRDVYATTLRLVFLGVDLYTLLMALSCALHEALKLRKHTLLAMKDFSSTSNTTLSPSSSSSTFTHTPSRAGMDLRLWEVEKALKNDAALSANLKKLITHIPSPHHLLADAFKAAELSALHLHRIVYESLLAPVAACLRGVRSLPSWKGVTANSSEYDDVTAAHPLDSADGGFSVQPSQYATVFCEHLLSLVQLISPPGHPLVQTAQRAVLLHGASAPASASIPSRVALSTISIQPIDSSSINTTINSSNSRIGSADKGSFVQAQEGGQTPLPFRASLSIYAQITAISVPQLGFAEISAVYDMLGAGQAPSIPSLSVGGGGGVDGDIGASGGPLATLNALASSFDAQQFCDWARESVIVTSNVSDTLDRATNSLSGGASALSSSSSSSSSSTSTTTTASSSINITAGEVAEEASAVAIASATLWLHGIARGAVALLLAELSRIPLLDCRTSTGPLQQLRADTSYVRAVLASMGIEVDPLFSRFADLATLSTSELESTLRGGLKEEIDDPVEAAARRAVAKMRKVGL